MRFVVEWDSRATETILAVHGELDLATVPDLRAAVDEALTAAPPAVYVDLSPTTFLDSTGCRGLISAAKGAADAGVPFALIAPKENRRVRRVVDLMQFDALMPVHDAAPFA